MASNHVFRNRATLAGDQVYAFSFTGNVASGTVHNVVDLPPGNYVVGFAIDGVANNHDAVLKVYPYANEAQTLVGAVEGVVLPNSTTCVSLATLSSTSTASGLVGRVASNMTGAFATIVPSIAPHGFRFTVSCTAAAGSGSWNLRVVAQEA